MCTRKKRFPSYYSMSAHNNGKSIANDMKVTCKAQSPVSIRVWCGFTQDSRPGAFSARGVQISAQMAFWTAQLAECVEEKVNKRNRVGAVAVLPSIHLHLGIGGDEWTELEKLLEGRAHCRSLGYARDDKVEGVAHLGIGGDGWTEL
jgi:hypothetical protein